MKKTNFCGTHYYVLHVEYLITWLSVTTLDYWEVYICIFIYWAFYICTIYYWAQYSCIRHGLEIFFCGKTFLEGTILPPFSDLTSIATRMNGFNQPFTQLLHMATASTLTQYYIISNYVWQLNFICNKIAREAGTAQTVRWQWWTGHPRTHGSIPGIG
jgi:hypothetical protein